MKLVDLSGMKFGRLLVLHRGENKYQSPAWVCHCDCGMVVLVSGGDLKRKYPRMPTRSCGCLASELTSQRARNQIKHGIARTREYKAWHAMIRRCYEPANQAFKNYGGRGIKVCEWLQKSPKNLFVLIGSRPTGRSLDRMNNDGHYSCGECKECITNGWTKNLRWATTVEQHRNTRKNRLISINGETRCLSEWAEKSGVSEGVIRYRLNSHWKQSLLLVPPTK